MSGEGVESAVVLLYRRRVVVGGDTLRRSGFDLFSGVFNGAPSISINLRSRSCLVC